jgi:hypothetical protein
MASEGADDTEEVRIRLSDAETYKLRHGSTEKGTYLRIGGLAQEEAVVEECSELETIRG